MLTLDDHPLLDAAAFTTHLPQPLDELEHTEAVQSLLAQGVAAPLATDDEVRGAVRKLLRHGGFKPSGRNKPASEYLLKAVEAERLATINPVVDTCNAVSLHSGLPISVIDLDKAADPFRIGIAEPDSAYVFNPSGQVLQLAGLLCLHDAQGPCANAVKDCQRTKTDGTTRNTLTIIWGTQALPQRTAQALAWHLDLLRAQGMTCEVLSQ